MSMAEDINPVLIFRKEDLPEKAQGQLKVLEAGTRQLGGVDDALRTVLDHVPGMVSRRVAKLVPEGFKLSEIEMSFKLDLEVPGIVKCGGDVKIKLAPSSGSK